MTGQEAVVGCYVLMVTTLRLLSCVKVVTLHCTSLRLNLQLLQTQQYVVTLHSQIAFCIRGFRKPA